MLKTYVAHNLFDSGSVRAGAGFFGGRVESSGHAISGKCSEGGRWGQLYSVKRPSVAGSSATRKVVKAWTPAAQRAGPSGSGQQEVPSPQQSVAKGRPKGPVRKGRVRGCN